jgi:8-amino-3,8-dideoxy-alpha-D-manno-octulosonate transaminase
MPGFEVFGEEERKEVNDVLESGVLMRYGFDGQRNGHWKAKEFEQEFAKYMGSKHCLLVSSGTAALITAMNALGIGAGDEVILPPFTFVATFEAVLQAGAIPVFAEIDETLCLDPAKIEEKITENTKAVAVVHMCGSFAQVDKIKEICDKRNLILIEDSCQAVGSTYKGKKIGTFGDVGCFSFDYVKTITCGEGGAIITDNEEIIKKCDYFHDHGHDHVGANRGLDEHPVLGTNFRTNELTAAVGLAQLRKIDKIIDIQRKNYTLLKESFEKFPGVKMREIPDESGQNAGFISVLFQSEAITRTILEKFKENGVGAAYWFDNNWHYIRKWEHLTEMKNSAKLPHEFYPNKPDFSKLKLPQSDDIISRTISMLINVGWSDGQIHDLKAKIEKSLTEVFG